MTRWIVVLFFLVVLVGAPRVFCVCVDSNGVSEIRWHARNPFLEALSTSLVSELGFKRDRKAYPGRVATAFEPFRSLRPSVELENIGCRYVILFGSRL